MKNWPAAAIAALKAGAEIDGYLEVMWPADVVTRATTADYEQLIAGEKYAPKVIGGVRTIKQTAELDKDNAEVLVADPTGVLWALSLTNNVRGSPFEVGIYVDERWKCQINRGTVIAVTNQGPYVGVIAGGPFAVLDRVRGRLGSNEVQTQINKNDTSLAEAAAKAQHLSQRRRWGGGI